MSLNRPENFINRELSWLQFNQRVLGEALDKSNPLLERLKFLAIVSSNLDEFFMIRVAGLKQQLEARINKTDLAGLTVKEQLTEISRATHEMVNKQYNCLKSVLLSLTKENLAFVSINELSEEQKNFLQQYFQETIYPVTTPMAINSSHPFPFLANGTLNLIVCLESIEKEKLISVIPVPSVLPRIIELPPQGTERQFVFLEEIIKEYSGSFFNGYTIKCMAAFRITRNGDLFLDEEEIDDLLEEVEKSLQQRKWGQPVRLEIEKNSSKSLRYYLSSSLGVNQDDIYDIPGPLDAKTFLKFSCLENYDQLRAPSMPPQCPRALIGKADLFEAIKEKDILVHHPYESFDCVLEFMQQAAEDPDVLAIKQTLYRVGGNSPIVQSLAQAAQNSKQVTVLVELRARFDEENNILWARQLEEAGCHVIYGLVGLKTHCKITLIVRREQGKIIRYLHLGTGNYNNHTAKLYTDIGLFTAQEQFGQDASAFFNLLSGYSHSPIWQKITNSPDCLRQKIYELIDQEISYSTPENPGQIIAKMNSLIDRNLILKLYEASNKGVKIELIVRGICGLRPNVPGVSENITVRSIVGHFLEHSRIFYFKNNGEEKFFLSSADWMTRNLDRRVELLFPVEDRDNQQRLEEILRLNLLDTSKSHLLQSDGSYIKIRKQKKYKFDSQKKFYELAREAVSKHQQDIPQNKVFQPILKQ